MDNYPEYLERNALIERIKKAYCDGCENYNGVRCRACGIGDAIDVVEDAPTAYFLGCYADGQFWD